MRKPIIAGNWKMNYGVKKAQDFINDIKGKLDSKDVEVVICPPYIVLPYAIELLKGTNVKVGAQNMHWETSGAYTGEVSGEMLKELGVEVVIIGHSERREYYNEKDETVNKKLKKALELGILPIVCVGETLDEREKGLQKDKVTNQVKNALQGVESNQAEGIVIAYEPIWAIGTGKTATSQQANEVCSWIRETLEGLYSQDVGDKIRIQYGGSVKPDNISELMQMSDIDGALVGGASIKMDFIDLVQYK